MAQKNWTCLLLGHRWKRHRAREGDHLYNLRTCLRCGHVETIEAGLLAYPQ